MATRKKRPTERTSEADRGNAVYDLARDLLERMTADRDAHEKRADQLARRLDEALRRNLELEALLEASRLATKVAEQERAEAVQERNKWAREFGGNPNGNGYQAQSPGELANSMMLRGNQ